jgi:protein NrfC
VYPACTEACPTGALHVDEANGNARTVDERKCIGCMRCVEACPYTPTRIQWDGEKGIVLKCDLCADTPYWNGQGGPDGMQACVAVCPAGAIKFQADVPSQVGDEGYDVDFYQENALSRGWT